MNFAFPKVLITLLLKFLVMLFARDTYSFICSSCIPLPMQASWWCVEEKANVNMSLNLFININIWKSYLIKGISEDLLIRLGWLVEDADNKYSTILMSQAFFPKKDEITQYLKFKKKDCIHWTADFLKFRFSELKITMMMTL